MNSKKNDCQIKNILYPDLKKPSKTALFKNIKLPPCNILILILPQKKQDYSPFYNRCINQFKNCNNRLCFYNGFKMTL